MMIQQRHWKRFLARTTALSPTDGGKGLAATGGIAPSWILSGVVAGVLAVSSSTVQAAEATVPAQAQRQYDVPAGALDGALKTFASQAGVMLSVDAALTQGKTSPGLKGNYEIARGFRVLLRNSGLAAEEDGAGNYLLKAQPAGTRAGDVQTLGKIKVQDAPDPDGSTEQGYRSDTVSAIGPWEGRSLQDTPYSVTVMPLELIENLQATTPDQIYRVTPTLQFFLPQHDNDQVAVNMRGFRVHTPYRDGLQGSNSGHGTAIEDVERIEVFTGLSGFLYGPGNVGGMINYVSKRPTAERLNRVTFGNSGGSSYYLQGDFGGPIDSDGRTGYRVNGIWQDGESEIDNLDIEKRIVSGAFDWHVTDTLLWQFDAAYRDYEVDGGQAQWLLVPGARRPDAEDIDASTSWGQKWTRNWFETRRYGTRLRWDPNDAFTLRTAWEYNNSRRSANVSRNIIFPNGTYTQRVIGQFARDDNDLSDEVSSHSAHAFADVRFETGAVAHKLTTGVQYQQYTDETFLNNAPAIVYSGLPLDRPSHFDQPPRAHVDRGARGRISDYSYTTVLIGDDVTFGDHWSLLAGLAHSTIDVEPITFLYPAAGYEKSEVTPNLSLIYKPVENVTTYASYIEAFEQGGVAEEEYGGVLVVNRGEVMNPLVTKQVEVGAKATVGGMLLTTALFQIDKALQYYDLRDPAAPRYVQDGLQVHRGIELTAFGKLTDDLTLLGGLTLLDAKVEEQRETPELEGKRPPNVAETLIKLRAEYQLPVLPALSLSGTVSYTSQQYGDTMNTDRLPSYTLFDVGTRYHTTLGQYPMTLRIDVNNLTDKAYWSWGPLLGTPRTVLFSVSTEF